MRPAGADLPAARAFLLAVVVLAAGSSGCGLPCDSRGTLERVRGGFLRCGVQNDWPFARLDDGKASGVEVTLVAALAEELGALPIFVGGTESGLCEALVRGELDLVIGGLTDESPWKDKVGFTRPYYVTRHLVAVAPGEPQLGDVEGHEIAVETGTEVAALLEDRDARVRRVRNLIPSDVPLAAPSYWIEAWGLTATDLEIDRKSHVMAVPPGENAWLVHVEEFLERAGGRVEQQLQEAVR